MSYGAVILNKVKSVYVGHLYHLVHNDELQNGMVCHVGDLVEGEIDLRHVEVPNAETINEKPLVLIRDSEVNYDESSRANAALNKYKIDAGKPARAYELNRDDEFSVTTNMLNGTAEVGKYVVAEAGSLKLKVVDAPTTEVFVGKIDRLETKGTISFVGAPGQVGNINEYAVIRVIKNS